MTLDLNDDEAAALSALLTRTVDEARYPYAPFTRALRAVLERLDGLQPAPAPVPPSPFPLKETRDKPHATHS